MYHPVQKVVESLYAAGRCPRLHVNALFEGVVCPDEIRARWRERLILDLDANYPLDLKYDDIGLSADLSFGGVVTRCVFPWGAVYVVADRATGRGIVLDQHLPESVRRASQLPTTGPLPERSDLRAVFEPPTDPPETDAPLAKSAEGETEPEGSPQPRERENSERKAQARRAAFRIIDGGS
jgi:stringent starvation protein B